MIMLFSRFGAQCGRGRPRSQLSVARFCSVESIHTMLVLGIESSCDETAAAVVRDGREIVSSVIASQIATHTRFGGVVPELASREHLDKIVPIVEEAFTAAKTTQDEIDGIAVTIGPGLVG